jgi:hypothetical protein
VITIRRGKREEGREREEERREKGEERINESGQRRAVGFFSIIPIFHYS